MSKLVSKTLSFPGSDSADVASYKLYVDEEGALSYDSESYDLGLNTSVDLSTIDGLNEKDGTFDIGVVTVDDAGNESDMSTLAAVPLDFQVPNPPGDLSLTE